MNNTINRKKKAELTKEKIYNAAIELFEEKGYDNVSIENITTKAGTAKGTFYIYYKSKQDLLLHTIYVYDSISDKAYNEVKHIDNFKEQMIEFINYYYSDIRLMGKEILKALYSDDLKESESFINQKNRKIYSMLSKIISLGIDKGDLSKSYGVNYYIHKIIILIMGIDYYWCTSPDIDDICRVASTEIEIFLKGLGVN